MLGISFCVKSCLRGNYGIGYAALSRVWSKALGAAHSQTPIKTNSTLAGFSDGVPKASIADHRASLQSTSLLQASASNFIQRIRDLVPIQCSLETWKDLPVLDDERPITLPPSS
jgi:hypothetical protein